MIREYRQIQALDIPSDNCTVYKVKKDNQLYLMHEFDSPNEFDEYSFKMRKKLSDCKHIGRLVEDFVEKDHKYYISEYMEGDLLKEILSHPGHLLELSTVLKYTAGLIEAI